MGDSGEPEHGIKPQQEQQALSSAEAVNRMSYARQLERQARGCGRTRHALRIQRRFCLERLSGAEATPTSHKTKALLI